MTTTQDEQHNKLASIFARPTYVQFQLVALVSAVFFSTGNIVYNVLHAVREARLEGRIDRIDHTIDSFLEGSAARNSERGLDRSGEEVLTGLVKSLTEKVDLLQHSVEHPQALSAEGQKRIEDVQDKLDALQKKLELKHK
jgi:peptidoglycan hydrolase CwlO-like protein